MKRMGDKEWSAAHWRIDRGVPLWRDVEEIERARDAEREAVAILKALRLDNTTDGDDVSFSWEELKRVRDFIERSEPTP